MNIFIDKNNDKEKTNLTLLSLSFHSFLNSWKSTKTLKFSGFYFVFVKVLRKIERDCVNGLFFYCKFVGGG